MVPTCSVSHDFASMWMQLDAPVGMIKVVMTHPCGCNFVCRSAALLCILVDVTLCETLKF